MIIKKKCWPKQFTQVLLGEKRYELRLADFDVSKDDTLILEEYNPETKEYTGRTIEKKVSFVTKFDINAFGQKKDIEEKGLYVIELK